MRIAVQITAPSGTVPESSALAASISETWPEADLHVLGTDRTADTIAGGTVTTVDAIDDTPFPVTGILDENDQVTLLTPRHLIALLDAGYDAVVHIPLRHVAIGRADRLIEGAIERGTVIAVPAPTAAAHSLTPEVALLQAYRGRNVGALAVTPRSRDAVESWDASLVDAVLDVEQRSIAWASSVFVDGWAGRFDATVEGTDTILDWGDYAAVATGRSRGTQKASLLDCTDLFGSLRHARVTGTRWRMPRGVAGITPVQTVIDRIVTGFDAAATIAEETAWDRFRAAVWRSIDPYGHHFADPQDVDDWLYTTSRTGSTRAAELSVLANPDLFRRFPEVRFDPTDFARWVIDGGREELGFDPFDRSYRTHRAIPPDEGEPGGLLNAIRWRWNHARVLVPGHIERVERRAHDRFVGPDPRRRRGTNPPKAVTVEREPVTWGNGSTPVGVVGPFRSESGLGMAARAGLNAVRSLGIPFHHVDVTDAYPSRNALDVGLTSDSYGQWGDINLLHINADEMITMAHSTYRHRFGGRFNAAMWFWETADLPRRSQGSLNIVDELWVSSHYLADVFGQYGKVPVRVVGLTAELPEPRPVDRSRFGWADDELVFLFVTDALSSFGRKNPVAAIEAFVAAFAPSFEGVRFVLKISNLSVFPDYHREVHAIADRHDAVSIIDDYLPYSTVLDLMSAADVYVSLHAAEGYGLTLLEAMAMGTPTVCTGYSGNMDFTDGVNSWLVDFDMMETAEASGPYPAGSVWARPRTDHVVEILRSITADPSQIAAKAAQARIDALEAASPERFAHRLGAELRRVR